MLFSPLFHKPYLPFWNFFWEWGLIFYNCHHLIHGSYTWAQLFYDFFHQYQIIQLNYFKDSYGCRKRHLDQFPLWVVVCLAWRFLMALSVCLSVTHLLRKVQFTLYFYVFCSFLFEYLPKVLQYIKLLGKDPLFLVLKFGPLHDWKGARISEITFN